MRVIRHVAAVFVFVLVTVGLAHASADLAKSKNCLACHAVDKKLIGPAFSDVQKKYAASWSASQRAALAQTILGGGSGVWGAIPMPPNPQVSDAEALQLVDWIMSLNGGAVPIDADPTPQTPASITPLKGLWWNPDQPGHGYSLHAVGDQLVLVWYTYDISGRPVWYLAANAYAGSSWSADLYRFRNFGATSDIVGTVSLTFSSATVAQVEWQSGGVTGGEVIAYFKFGDGSTTRRLYNQTGLYFDPADDGYGLSVVSQGHGTAGGCSGPDPKTCSGRSVVSDAATEVSVLYFYDSDGNPLWALGSGDYVGVLTSTLDMYLFHGSCPNCSYVTPSAAWVGTMKRDHVGQVGGFACTIDNTLAGFGGRWERESNKFVRLSDGEPIYPDY